MYGLNWAKFLVRVQGRVRDGDSDKQTTTDGRTDRFSKANIVSDVAYNTLRQK